MKLSRRHALRCGLSATAALAGFTATTYGPVSASANTAGVKEVNVRDCGATGDGVTDETEFIHAARDLAGVGGIVVFPPGTYLTTGLRLDIASQLWRIMPGAIIKTKDSGSRSGPITVDATNITITGGGTIDGNRSVIGGNAHVWSGITGTVNSTDLTVDGLTIRNTVFYGVWGQAPRTRVVRCTLTENQTVPIMLSSFYLAVQLGSTMQNTYEMEASDNFIDRTAEGISLKNAAIQIRGNGGPYGALHQTYRGKALRNTIIMPTSPTEKSGFACGIEFGAQSYYGLAEGNVVVNGTMGISFAYGNFGKAVGNTLIGQTLFAIEISESPGVIIQGNIIDGSNLLGTASTGSGIVSNGTGMSKDLTIMGNRIFGMPVSTPCISLGASSRASVSGNTLESVNGIHLSETNDVIIGSNIMTGKAGYDTSYGVFITNSQRITVSGNRMRHYAFAVRIQATSGMKDSFSIRNNSFQDIATPVEEIPNGGTLSNVTNADNQLIPIPP